MTLMHCRECGHKISAKATFCPHCGDGMVDYHLSFRTLSGGDIATISKK